MLVQPVGKAAAVHVDGARTERWCTDRRGPSSHRGTAWTSRSGSVLQVGEQNRQVHGYACDCRRAAFAGTEYPRAQLIVNFQPSLAQVQDPNLRHATTSVGGQLVLAVENQGAIRDFDNQQ